MKTLFTIMLCVTTLILRISYPFTPKQLLLLEMFVIGVPSFILTFQPNSELIKGNFIPQVLKKSIPCSLLMFINILIVVILNENTNTLTPAEFTSLSTMLLTFVGFINLVWICWPLNWLKGSCVAVSAILIISCISGLGKFFTISEFTVPVMVTLFTLLLCSAMLIACAFYLKEWWINRKLAKAQVATISDVENVTPENQSASKESKPTKKKQKKYSAENIWQKITNKLSKDETIPEVEQVVAPKTTEESSNKQKQPTKSKKTKKNVSSGEHKKTASK